MRSGQSMFGRICCRADEAPRVRALLREYTAHRIRFYTSRNWDDIDRIRSDTAKVQDRALDCCFGRRRMRNRQPLRALVVSGMNDVLNSEGYTQAAWWNRIPVGAWVPDVCDCSVLQCIWWGLERGRWSRGSLWCCRWWSRCRFF